MIGKSEEIIAAYESGLTIREIANNLGASYESIRKVLKAAKIKWHRNYVSDLAPDQVTDIIKKFDKGETINKIAQWYELSPPAISRLLRANNRTPIAIFRKYDILRATPLNSIQRQVLVGHLLGDGHVYSDTEKGHNKISISQCKKQEQYFHWKVAMFDPFVNTYRENVGKDGNIQLNATSICHQDVDYFRNIFYTKDRIKIVPKNLDMFLTPLALAVWIQDDGNLNAGVNMRIASMNFTENENYILRDYLNQVFDLRAKVMGFKYKGKQYWQLTLNKENTQKLSDLIRDHIVECMEYKIMPKSSTTTC